MRTIRQITPFEIEECINIFANAYPGLELADTANRERFKQRLAQLEFDPSTNFFALFDGGQMRGVMRWHDFTMNFNGTRMHVGGLGGVAVDLLHKKEKVAAEMVQAFLRHYKDAGAPLVALYPFRPDFYRRMGFGYGAPMHNYRFSPASLPKGPSKSELVFLDKRHIEQFTACYDRYYQRTHGMMARRSQFFEKVLGDPGIQTVGAKSGDSLTGYLSFSFEKGKRADFLSNNIHLRELVYQTGDDLSRLLTFLSTQADQIEQVIYNTQDDSFFYLLQDPRLPDWGMLPNVIGHESSTQGLGIMYRALSVPHLFEVLENHNFGDVSCRLEISLRDSFFPENAGDYRIEFDSGKASVAPETTPEVKMSIDIADFSSLVIGAVPLHKLTSYGLAALSDASYLGHLDRLFGGPKPICLTSF